MQILVSVKQPGRRKAGIGEKPIRLEGNFQQPVPLRNLLEAITLTEVQSFNQKREEKSLLHVLNPDQINQSARAGRVSFGEVYNAKTINPEQARETMLLAFEDGLFAVFLEDEQIESLETEVQIRDNSHLTFVRLTFLAGSIF